MTKNTRARFGLKKAWDFVIRALGSYWRHGLWNKIVILSLITLTLLFCSMYGIARWYAWTQKDVPQTIGTSFIPAYAESLGLDPEATMDALINDLGIRHFRLVSYWNQIESQPGVYDFSILDWQFEKAEQAGAQVSLSIGLRQPRWPECHEPDWIDTSQPEDSWTPQLYDFMTATIMRYKDSPALKSYQLENEYFLAAFGECKNFNRERLVEEYNLVRRLDPATTIIISRSNNALGTPIREPIADKIAVSVYKRTWSPYIERNLEYPFPPWFYGYLGGIGKLTTGKDMVIHELQAEAWPPYSIPMQKATLDQQNQTFSADIFRKRIQYGKDSGIKEIYLWSGEYWYYRKEKLNDPSLWEVARQQLAKSND